MNGAAWLRHYDEGVPAAIGKYPNQTLVDFSVEHARTQPNATAVIFKGRQGSRADRAAERAAEDDGGEGPPPGARGRGET